MEKTNIIRKLRGSRMFNLIPLNTGIYKTSQCKYAQPANKINQFHNIYLSLYLLFNHIKINAAIINTDVTHPPMGNNILGGISCLITPASNMPPMSNFATSSKNLANSIFMMQKYDNNLKNTNPPFERSAILPSASADGNGHHFQLLTKPSLSAPASATSSHLQISKFLLPSCGVNF